MSEDRKQIEAALDRLTDELMSSNTFDPATAQRWQALLRDLRQALAADNESRTKHSPKASESSLAHRVSEAALEFEATHPTLSGSLGSIIDALGRMGI